MSVWEELPESVRREVLLGGGVGGRDGGAGTPPSTQAKRSSTSSQTGTPATAKKRKRKAASTGPLDRMFRKQVETAGAEGVDGHSRGAGEEGDKKDLFKCEECGLELFEWCRNAHARFHLENQAEADGNKAVVTYQNEADLRRDLKSILAEPWNYSSKGGATYKIVSKKSLNPIGTIKVHGELEIKRVCDALKVPPMPWARVCNGNGCVYINYYEGCEDAYDDAKDMRNIQIDGVCYRLSFVDSPFPETDNVPASPKYKTAYAAATGKTFPITPAATPPNSVEPLIPSTAGMPPGLPHPPRQNVEPSPGGHNPDLLMTLIRQQKDFSDNVAPAPVGLSPPTQIGSSIFSEQKDATPAATPEEVEDLKKKIMELTLENERLKADVRRADAENDVLRTAVMTQGSLETNLKQELLHAQMKIGQLTELTEKLAKEKEKEWEERIKSKGRHELLQEQSKEYLTKAEDESRRRRAVEKDLEETKQSLLARALLDDFVEYLRPLHTTTDVDARTGRKTFLQYCTCTSCETTFSSLYTIVCAKYALVGSFDVAKMRKALAEAYDRFSKVAHPTEKKAIRLNVFGDHQIEHALYGVAVRQNWPVENA
ncbi:hypothetical protein HK104_004654 [Borealophlyctis nickersoniae]|nr:hypothetical protein HK104_004654 [Borealophlyctis nickersoniae]